MSPRPRAALALVSVLVLAACGGGSASPAATSAPAGSPAAGASDAPPTTGTGGGNGGGGETVRVVLTGGPDAGTYTTTEDPMCSQGIVGEGGWGVQYSTADLSGDKDFTSLQLVNYPDGSPEGAMFQGVKLLTTITIGPLMDGRDYEIRDDEDPDKTEGEGEATIADQGGHTVITVKGKTADGVGVDVTVTCPSVTGG